MKTPPMQAILNDPRDISPDFTGPNPTDSRIARRLIALQGTPRALHYFTKHAHELSDYSYWFFLGTLWVHYSGFTDLQVWRRLFQSDRPNKRTSLMKPSEVYAFDRLPGILTIFRAHREHERDWIAYTMHLDVAARMAHDREGSCICSYIVSIADVDALFLRRSEWEIIVTRREQVFPA